MEHFTFFKFLIGSSSSAFLVAFKATAVSPSAIQHLAIRTNPLKKLESSRMLSRASSKAS